MNSLTDFSKLPFALKIQRSEEKKIAILDFLEDETWTTLPVLIQLLGTSRTSVERSVSWLLKERLIKQEKLEVGSKLMTLIGITQHCINVTGKECKPFHAGATNPSFVRHHLQVQEARLKALKYGAKQWICGHHLNHKSIPLSKVPDGIYRLPNNKLVAVEIENYIKSPSRFADAVSLHLKEMQNANRWVEVHYIVPVGQVENIKNAFSRICVIPVNSANVQLTDEQRALFKFFTMENWQPISDENILFPTELD